jgi:hypothetical protein
MSFNPKTLIHRNNLRSNQNNITTPIKTEIDMIKVIDIPEYRTRGEAVLLVKDVDNCKIILDSTNTFAIKIKTMTKTIIMPLVGKIDDEYDEILIDKGACVEFYFMSGGWYILSSDGLKLGD